MQRITTLNKWCEVLEQSKFKPCLVLKISMTCISSISALKEYKELQTELPKYLVIVQMDRVISNAIACDLQVKHESPQLIILQGGKRNLASNSLQNKALSFGKRYRTICKKRYSTIGCGVSLCD